MSLDYMWYTSRLHRRHWTSYLFTGLEVLATGHGQNIKIPGSSGLSSGYHSSQIYVKPESSLSGTMPDSSRAAPQIPV